MGVFDEEGEEFKNLPKEFKTMVKFVNRGKKSLENLAESIQKKEANPETLKEGLEKSKEIIDRQFKLIEKFISLPTDVAIVSSVEEKGGKKFVWILQNGRRRKVNFPEKVGINPGMLVEVSSQTAQIIDEAKLPCFGSVAKVAKILSDNTCEVGFGSEARVVLRGTFGLKGVSASLEVGDRVVLDQSGVIILANLGKEKSRFKPPEFKITWDDIVGLDDAKQTLREMIELPYTRADLFKHHNMKQIKGAILHGPHGNGKSMLLEASIGAYVKVHGAESLESGCQYVKAAELLEGIVGEGEKNTKRMFDRGEEHFEKHGYPALITIEEPDAVFIKRGSGISSDVERPMVDTMLAEMNHTHSILIMATNRLDILDPALVRDKRIDNKIYVGRPGKDAIAVIVERNLSVAPLSKSAKELAEYAASELFSEKRALYDIKRKSSGEIMKLTLGHIAYGAMAANIAEKAKYITFRRDEKENTKTATGEVEILGAIDEIFKANVHMDHIDEIRDFTKDFREDIADIKTLRQGRN